MTNLLIFHTLLYLTHLFVFIIREKSTHEYRFMSFERSQTSACIYRMPDILRLGD